jgi:hypothetical protein
LGVFHLNNPFMSRNGFRANKKQFQTNRIRLDSACEPI